MLKPQKPHKSSSGRSIRPLDRNKLLLYVVSVIFACLLVNGLLVMCHLADGHALSERVGAVFCAACGALVTLLTRGK
jgi:hypothetical protein